MIARLRRHPFLAEVERILRFEWDAITELRRLAREYDRHAELSHEVWAHPRDANWAIQVSGEYGACRVILDMEVPHGSIRIVPTKRRTA